MTGRRVWVVTDGRPGNEGPAGALARALAARGWAPAEIRRVTPRPWAARLPAGLWARRPFREGGWPFNGYEADAAALTRPWPDLVISAGRRSAPAAAALRALSGGATRAVQVLDPRMPLAMFDAVITPAHDARAGANVIPTLGSLSRVTPELAAAAARDWAGRFETVPQPRLAVLLGGPSRAARWRRDDARRVADALARVEAEGWGVLVTGSRRTPEGVMNAVRTAVRIGFVWDGQGENPYPGVLGGRGALVSWDSVNMVSEAASAGVAVNLLGVGTVSAKLRRFHEQVIAGGWGRVYDGEVRVWDAEPLREAERVAGILAERLG